MTPKETLAARADMLAATLSKDQQKKFRSAYLSMKGNWKEVQEHLAVEGIPADMLQHLELTNHLADITDNNATLVRSLQEEKVSSLYDLALNFDSTRLASLIKPDDLPKNISGETQEEKTLNYITSIENTLYRKAPSAVISRMVKNGVLPVKDAGTRNAMLAFFEQQPDFDIRATSVYAAVNEKATSLRSIDPLQRPQVTEELKSLQRAAVMSDTPDVLPKLMAANITSAHQVVKQSKSAFVKNYATQLGGENAAEMVYERAADINTRNEYALMALRDAVTGVPIAAISGRYTDGERQKALIQVAEENNVQLNWEALFGNADFCECDECRSVYSPSAYFVELLQFLRNNNLDPEKTQAEDPKDISGSVLEKLFRRRPDLGNLQLTCENTNTALPYVDLVNEIMESFVVHLPEYQADGTTHLDVFNVGEETSNELLAVPQHVNYDAYCRLKKAVYPFTLPFHQPIAAIRILLESLGTSRHELMNTFRSAVNSSEKTPVGPEVAVLEQEALNRAADAEFLQMTQEEYVILTKQGFYAKAFFDAKCEKPVTEEEYSKAIGVKPVWEYYGYTNAEDMISRLKEVKKGFLQRTGILYKELTDLLNTHYINPAYPKGKTLTTLQRIPYSYRYLQSLVLPEATEPAVKYAQVIALLEPVFADPCEKTDIRKWVLKHFERIGKMVVLESGVQPESDYYYYYNMQTAVNGYGELSYSEVADDCDINKVKIQHLDGTDVTVDEYDRIQRFIRLWRKTGWTTDEVDKAITGLGAYDLPCNPLPPQEDDCLDKFLDQEDCSCNGKQEAEVSEQPETKGYDITPAFIHQLVAVKKLLATTNLPLVKLLAFWTEIDTYGKNSLYRKLFLTHNLKAIDPVFHADKYGNYLTKSAKISEHIPVLMAALQMKPADLDAIIAYNAIPDSLTLEHVSIFFRYGTLAKLLRQSIPELIEDIRLLGDPFKTGYDTLQFIQLFNNINSARFKPAQLNYIIRDVADPKANLAPSPKAVLALAKTLYDGLRKIASDTPDIPEAEISAELLRSKLELLFSKDIVTGVLGLLDGSTLYSAQANSGLEINIPDELKVRVTYDKVKGLLSVTGILAPAQVSLVQALSTDKAFQAAIADITTKPGTFFDDTLFAIFSNQVAAKQILLAPDGSPETSQQKLVYCYSQYLPFLRKKLGLQLIIQVLSANLKLDAETTEVLVTEILRSEDGNEPLIADIDKLGALQTGDDTTWKGYLSPAIDDKYTFVIRSESAVTLLIDNEAVVLFPQPNNAKLYESEPQRLKSGQLYKFQVSGINGDLSALSWKTPTIPKMQIPDSLFFPAVASEAFGISFRRLHKAALVINGFQLTIEELEHFDKYKNDFGGLDFNGLSLEHWRSLFDYTQLRGSFAATETSLPEFFTWAQQPNGVVLAEKVATLTGWVQADVEKLIASAHYNYTIADFVNEKALVKLQHALKVSELIGMDINKLFEWAKPTSKFNVTHQIAENIRSAMQSRYSQDEWEQVVKPLNDNLRNQQKKALISYLLVQPPLQDWADDHGVVLDADTLFEFFLIDVQMETSMETSRIKQAISSVQTYVQRCFLGLETDVAVDELDNSRWQWMQRYRVWEANRKVFLYPENWIQPELRDSKSSFFKELEAELMQKDITMDNVQTALMNYLQKLEEVSRLDTCAIYQEYMEDKKAPKRMHVFARTRNAPYIYYYRHFDNVANTWSPWDKIQTDIQQLEDDREDGVDKNRPDGVCLIPAVWNNRLLLFWPIVSKKQKVNSGNNDKNFHQLAETKFSSMKNTEYREIKLAWSEHKNGKWTTRQTSSCIIKTEAEVQATPLPDIFFVQNVQEDYIKINAYDVSSGNAASIGAFLFKFGNIISAATADAYNPVRHRPAQAATRYMNYYWEGGSLDLTDDGSATGMLFDHHLHDFKVVRPLQQEYDNAVNTTYPLVYQEELSNEEKNGRVFVGIERQVSYDPARKYLEIEVFHHPYVGKFIQQLNREGVPGLLSYLTQSDTKFTFDYWQDYNPKNATYIGGGNYGVMDFGEGSWRNFNEERLPYAVYNWELFFHIPLLIANQLSKSQRFEEAMQWFHYIFNPMSKGPENDVKRYWQFVPFKTDVPETLMAIFNSLQPNRPDQNISNWRDRPFNPHLVARSRPTAYMKTVVMKYLDNLVSWGDQLYRQNTLETINQATMLYVMAGHILGPRPQLIPKRGNVRAETYNNLLDKWDAFSNAMVEMELIFPFSNQVINNDRNGTDSPYPGNNIYGFAASLYFGIPNNPNLLGYWDTVADRLFKIRNSMNIDGIVQKLPLFEPPIDPGLLVQAAAMGISLSSVLSDLNAPMPYYRFQHLIQKSLELCNEVKVLGGTLLSVFEKKDAEALARLRATHESNILNLMKSVKEKQLEEASSAVDTLLQNRESSAKRLQHYQQLLGVPVEVPAINAAFKDIDEMLRNILDDSGMKLIDLEKEDMDKAGEAANWQTAAGLLETAAGIANFFPSMGGHGTPLGVGVAITFGGQHVGAALAAAARGVQTVSNRMSYESSSAAKKNGFLRQRQDWIMQANSAGRELMQIDKQLTAANIRIAIATNELENQHAQIEQSKEMEDYLRNKYTNGDLYQWMEGQVKTVYHQAYQLAYDMAKKAEKTYRFERGEATTNFIQFGYWDSSHDGLMAGEQLSLAIKQMEKAYMDNNKREYEITKHISLAQLSPLGLISLKETGVCEISLPEELFDMDFPGHYMRRLKSVAVSIPCVAGPYTSVNATLTLLQDKTRIKSLAGNQYGEDTASGDDRFVSSYVSQQSIATSSGQSDSGMFELNFRDERYLPFEGAGAVSRWRLSLPAEFRQFDYDTISDVILHVRYTAREGGNALKSSALGHLDAFLEGMEEENEESGLFRLFSLRHEFANEWYQFLHPAQGQTQQLKLTGLADRLPFFTRSRKVKGKEVLGIELLLRGKAVSLQLNTTDMQAGAPVGDIRRLVLDNGFPAFTDDWVFTLAGNTVVTAADLQDAWLIVRYGLSI